MKTIRQLAVKGALAVAALGGVLGVLAAPDQAKADPYVVHYYTPSVHVHRVYVPRVVVPRFYAPTIHVRAYHPGFTPWAPGGVIVRRGVVVGGPYAPVVLPW